MNQSLITAIGFSVIFIATSLGASLVFAFKRAFSERFNSVLIGAAAGIMLSAAIWSLIIPSLELTKGKSALSFLSVPFGIIAGSVFLHFTDKAVSVLSEGSGNTADKNAFIKSAKMFIAMTVHNIPEGLAVGFAFGSASMTGTAESYATALGLAIGIAIQNFPEGMAVAFPLKSAGKSNFAAFSFGALSGAVEPVAAVVGYFLSFVLTAFQPWFLSFAAGAMLFVVFDDLVPESKIKSVPHLGTWGAIIGFSVMMILDVALG